jgi:hypothetical protein
LNAIFAHPLSLFEVAAEPAIVVAASGAFRARAAKLHSKASDFYTGHFLYADGGYTAG